MIKLLIVDDSALMRRQLTTLFERERDFEIRQARNGAEAVTANTEFAPDVVTLDINMPEMDGLTALSLMMAQRPVPVVMVSSLTEEGALVTLEALNLGAIDFAAKPGGTISLSIEAIAAQLITKVRSAASARLKPARRSPGTVRPPAMIKAATRSVSPDPATPGFARPGVVVIGVSTGGPRTLSDILPTLPATFPWPVLVAQHMPAAFTKSFAQRLDSICPLQVVEVSAPMPIQPGTIYLGKGGTDMVVTVRVGRRMVAPQPSSPRHAWHPSVELLGRSVLAHIDPARVAAVMLTGMGHDGSDAFAEIRRRGGKTIAESEDSAVVFGMPKELIDRGGASLVLAADKIPAQLGLWAGQ